MICGLLKIQQDILKKLLAKYGVIGLDELQHNGQLMMDCY